MYGIQFLFLLVYIPNVKERVGVENFGDCLCHSSDKQLPSASAWLCTNPGRIIFSGIWCGRSCWKISLYIYINYSIRCYMPISRVKIQTLQTKLVRGERFFKQWLCLSLQKAFYPTKIRFIAWFYINPRCSADCHGSSNLLGPCLPRLEVVNFDPKSQQSILLQLPLVC